MTYLLQNSDKMEVLDNNCIPFLKTNNTIFVFWEGQNALPVDVTNTSDEAFFELVKNY